MIYRIDVRTDSPAREGDAAAVDPLGEAVRQQIREFGRDVGNISTRRIFLIDTDVGTRVDLSVRTLRPRAPNHVVEDIMAADGGSASAVLRNVVDFPDLKSQDVSILVERNI